MAGRPTGGESGQALSLVRNLPARKDSAFWNPTVENPPKGVLPPDLVSDLPLHRLGNPSVEAFPSSLCGRISCTVDLRGDPKRIFPEYALSGVRPRASQARK